MKRLEIRQKRCISRHILLSFSVSLLAALLYWVLLTPLFATNDDIGMSGIIYGYSGTYEPNMVFINPLIGYLLRGLLRLLPAVPWYAVLQCAVVFFSLFGMVFVFSKRGGIGGALLFAAVFFAYFGYMYFCRIQFSQTAGIACIAGFLLLFFYLESGGSWTVGASGAALILVGSLYRFSVFEMLLIPFFGVGLRLLIAQIKKRDRKELIRTVAWVAATFVLCFSAYLFHVKLNGSTAEWKEYTEYNALRSELLDYGFPVYEENEALYRELNISYEDLMMFANWNFADPDVFNVSSMKALVAAKAPRTVSVDEFIKVCVSWVQYAFFPAAALCALFALLGGKLRREKLLLLVYEVLAAIGVVVYLYCSGRYLIPRIDVSLALGFSAIVLCESRWEETEHLKKGLCVIAAVVLLGTLSVGFSRFWTNRGEKTADRELCREIDRIDQYLAADREHLYLCEVFGLPETANIWRVCEEGHASNRYGLGGWGTDAPFTNEILDRYGIQNPYKDCVDNPSVYFIAGGGRDISLSLNYIRRHYCADAQAECIAIINWQYRIYRVVSSGVSADSASAVPGEGRFGTDLRAYKANGNIIVTGHADTGEPDGDDTDTVVEIRTEAGSRYYCATKIIYADNDGENGAFKATQDGIRCEAEDPPGEEKVYLYIKHGGTLYSFDLGHPADEGS